MNYYSFSFLMYFRPSTGGWYISLLEYNRGDEDLAGWCFLALCWLPNYRRLKVFFNKTL